MDIRMHVLQASHVSPLYARGLRGGAVPPNRGEGGDLELCVSASSDTNGDGGDGDDEFQPNAPLAVAQRLDRGASKSADIWSTSNRTQRGHAEILVASRLGSAR